MSNIDTRKREIKGLLNACKNFNLDTGVIITYDSEDEYMQDDIVINEIPFYKWVI